MTERSQPMPVAVDGVYLADGKLNVPFLFQNAELLLRAGDAALAKNIYKTIITSGERTAAALLGLARCFEREGKLPETRANLEDSIAYQPSFEAFDQLADVLIRQKKEKHAAEILARALNIKDLSQAQRFHVHHKCAKTWANSDQPEHAEAHMRKALELSPGADDLRADLGMLYQTRGQPAEAVKYFKDALISNPKNAKALFGIGLCALAEGRKREAHDLFAASLNENILNPVAIFHLVKCAYEIKSYVSAARLLGEYIEVAPVNSNLLYSLAGLQYHLGRWDECRSTTNKVLQIAPQHAGAKELLPLTEKARADAGGAHGNRL